MTRHSEAGVTLVELLVVLAVLSIMAALVGLAPPRGRRLAGESQMSIEAVAVVRSRALESGRPAGGTISIQGRSIQVLAFPDGRVLGAEELGVNPLTGAVDALPAR
jgi:prepilin-type N-terminal cleavage/methylation domain-containing protein